MAGYVKIWTTLTAKREWITLSALNRGIYLQILLWCKSQGDNSRVIGQSWSALGALLGCDRKTAARSVGKLAEKSLCNYIKNEDGSIEIVLPKYRLWQEIDVKSVVSRKGKSRGKIPPLRPDQTRPDQTRLMAVKKPPSKTDSEHHKVIEYFCDQYEKKVGAKYRFHGKEDGAKIKTLLKRWSVEQVIYLIDTMFNSSDEFYRTGGGYSIGVLLATDNKLVQEAQRVRNGTNKLNKHGAATAAAAARVLKEMECQETAKKLLS